MKNVPINSVNNKFTLGTRKKNYVRPALVKKDKLPCACIKKKRTAALRGKKDQLALRAHEERQTTLEEV